MTLAKCKPTPQQLVSSFADQRLAMVELQLWQNGIRDERVLTAMAKVPRDEFVPTILKASSYGDCPLSIGHGQTISQPFTVAFMCQALQFKGHERVLEIGTGSGYAAAVLSLLANKVFTIERIDDLATAAAARLKRLDYTNVEVIAGDGTLGLPEAAPFDGIVATAAAGQLPPPLAPQLAEGGRIVMPIGGETFDQCLYRFTKRGGELHGENLGCFAFVPLLGQFGWRR